MGITLGDLCGLDRVLVGVECPVVGCRCGVCDECKTVDEIHPLEDGGECRSHVDDTSAVWERSFVRHRLGLGGV